MVAHSKAACPIKHPKRSYYAAMYCTNEKYKAISGFSRVGPWVGDVLQHRLLGSDQMRNRTKNKTPESVANTITEKMMVGTRTVANIMYSVKVHSITERPKCLGLGDTCTARGSSQLRAYEPAAKERAPGFRQVRHHCSSTVFLHRSHYKKYVSMFTTRHV